MYELIFGDDRFIDKVVKIVKGTFSGWLGDSVGWGTEGGVGSGIDISDVIKFVI